MKSYYIVAEGVSVISKSRHSLIISSLTLPCIYIFNDDPTCKNDSIFIDVESKWQLTAMFVEYCKDNNLEIIKYPCFEEIPWYNNA